LDSAAYIAIYLPLFIIFAIELPWMRKTAAILRLKRKRRMERLTNDLVKKYIGRVCYVSTGSFGASVKGKIVEVMDNWIEIRNHKGSQLLNADFVTNIRPIDGEPA